MIPVPDPEEYNVSPDNGFLPSHPPLDRLPDSYYEPWEHVVKNLQGLILSGRLHEMVDKLPVLSVDRLDSEAQWRRAYSVLAFITHAYIWGGRRPMEWVPPSISIPFLATCKHLELPPVATYAGLCLWNWKPIFESERIDTLNNLDMIETFTGSLDEKWFYLVSVAIEARGAATIPIMLDAIRAADRGDRITVAERLRDFAERVDELGALLMRMYDNCDPHVFYHRFRPFLAGTKNMADAGLPNGVVFDNGGPMNKQRYVQYSGGSNAQSSLIQFFDAVLGVQHLPTGVKQDDADAAKKQRQESFHQEMRRYMPGPHARFLEAVGKVANIKMLVDEHQYDKELRTAYDASLAMLSALRDKHMQIVSRYIIVQSRESRKDGRSTNEPADKAKLPVRTKSAHGKRPEGAKKDLKGTGGTSLIQFLRQARNETGEPAVDAWTRKLLSKGRGGSVKEYNAMAKGDSEACQGLASVWHVHDSDGGLCLV